MRTNKHSQKRIQNAVKRAHIAHMQRVKSERVEKLYNDSVKNNCVEHIIFVRG